MLQNQVNSLLISLLVAKYYFFFFLSRATRCIQPSILLQFRFVLIDHLLDANNNDFRTDVSAIGVTVTARGITSKQIISNRLVP